VREGRTLPVPLHLRDKNYQGAKEVFGHGKGYKYPHDFEGAYVPEDYLPDELIGERMYDPTESGFEAELKRRLAALRARKPG
jgi:putative ATPase